MSDCSTIRPLLALYDDADPSQSEIVRKHLFACLPCRDEWNKFLMVISAGREAGRLDLGLPDGVRYRIASQAAERAARGRWTARWLPGRGFALGKGTLAAVTAGLVVMFALPYLKQQAPSRHDEISPRIEVVSLGGAVRLAWTDGRRASYTVFKSTDPRETAGGEAHVVRGNAWVDTDPDSSPVVFYRIE